MRDDVQPSRMKRWQPLGVEQQQPQLIIARSAGHYRDAARSYRIEIDGIARGHLRPGQELALDVTPGEHQVRARISWTGSPTLTLDVAPGEVKSLLVEPAGPASSALLQIFGTTSCLKLTEQDTSH